MTTPERGLKELRRSLDRWQKCDADAMSKQSTAAVAYALDDAKHDIALIAKERDQLRARCGELEKACRYVLNDDGLIPRATSKCREVVRAALNEQNKAPQPAQEQKAGCDHAHYSYRQHGNRCTCGQTMVDHGL